MNPPTRNFSRRAVMRGFGAAIGLPFLESLAPTARAASGGVGVPRRLVFLYSPNGRHMKLWTPVESGPAFALPPTLEPLAPLRSEVTVISGLDHEQAMALGDGPGDHARANACFLSGVHPRKTAGSDIRAGISVDQLAASKIGHLTRLPSLELGTDDVRSAGRCDSGYACAYQFNLSWKSESTPMPPETRPRALFEKLFGGDGPEERTTARLRRLRARKSVLDYALESGRALARTLGTADRTKLDEFLESVREVERRIERAERSQAPVARPAPPPDAASESYTDHLRIMFDLLALALQTDSTRIATFLMASEASLRPFRDLGISDAHHFLSHHQGNEAKLEKLARIDRWYVERVAEFLTKLRHMPEAGGGSVLDHSLIVYGCGIADGNDHGHENLPILLAGRGSGTLDPGRHLVCNGPVPVTNLFRALLKKIDIPTDKFGDSTGVLEGV